jgi:hypothetical protein
MKSIVKNKKYAFLLFTILLNISAFGQMPDIYSATVNANIFTYLRNNFSKDSIRHMDLSESYFLRFDSGRHYVLRIPFKGKSITTDFIALQTDSLGNCSAGSIVHLYKGETNNPYTDTFYIYNLQRTKKWIVFSTMPAWMKRVKDTAFKENIIPATKNTAITDPAVILSCSVTECTYYVNVFAILHPDKIEKDGDDFGVPPTGWTSGGFGTYSEYFNINLSRQNFLTPVADKIEFERPENLPAIDLKNELK